jgi:hypothetical protein
MTKISVGFSVSNNYDFSEDLFQSKVAEISSHVSSGGYLFLISEYSSDLKPTRSLESVTLRTLMGPPKNRGNEWSFFGNGAIRSYSPVRCKLTSTWQWIILQKEGERTLEKRHRSNPSQLKKVSLPVSHPAFTRDVANNVWHLNEDTLVKTAIGRFRSLLTWPDESLLHFHNNQKKIDIPFSKLNLGDDLIGVAQKKEYLWNNQDTLF